MLGAGRACASKYNLRGENRHAARDQAPLEGEIVAFLLVVPPLLKSLLFN